MIDPNAATEIPTMIDPTLIPTMIDPVVLVYSLVKLGVLWGQSLWESE